MKKFEYNSIIALDDSMTVLKFLHKHKIDQANFGKKALGVLFDHRKYKLDEKNFIKWLLEIFSLDCLKFTLRPSAASSLNQIEPNIEKFKSLSALSYVMQCMVRYEIDNAYISSNNIFLKPLDDGSVSGDELFKYLDNWLSQNNNAIKSRKDLCSINYIYNLSAKLSDKKIFFMDYLIDDLDDSIQLQYDYFDQISPLEKDLFWIGFDPSFKEVPWEKPYKESKWTKELKNIPEGDGYYENKIKYCSRCCMPETMEGIEFDEFGRCTPCRSSEEKMHINWEVRQEGLVKTLNSHKNPDYYDCLFPMSGGKDSTFQAHCLIKRYKVNPLAVTHGQNWYSLSGRYNMENCLQKFDLDHLFFAASRSIVNKAAKKSIDAIGDACWHCHIGAGSFVIQTAVDWDLKLMIWGESIAERDGRGSYYEGKEHSAFYNLEVSALIRAEDYDDNNISKSELSQWYYPTEKVIEEKGIRYLHLGDFIFWDEEKQVEFLVKEYEWMDSKVENTFKGYKSTECVMAGVHDYLNFLKRGIGRSTIHASDDVRRGLMTRSEGMELSKKHDAQRPHALDFYMDITGLSEEKIEDKIIKARELSEYAKKLNQR
jgi:N-acetyl sugar amidotransferase